MLQRLFRHPGWCCCSSHHCVWLHSLLPPWLSLNQVWKAHSHHQGWLKQFFLIQFNAIIFFFQCACIPAILALVVSTWMLIQPSLGTWVVVTCAILGVCSLGIYPIMLELSVECTYPLDESVVTGLCYLSSAIQVCEEL